PKRSSAPVSSRRLPVSTILFAFSTSASSEAITLPNSVLFGKVIASDDAEVENAKRIVDSGNRRDDTGADERFGRRPRVRGGRPPILRRLVQPLLGALLGSCLWRLLLWESQRG